MRSKKEYLGTIVPVDGATVELPNGLPNINLYEALLLRFTATFNHTASGAGTVAALSPLNYFKQIEISHPQIPGGGLVRRVNGMTIYQLAKLMRGIAGTLAPATNGTTGSDSIEANLIIPFGMERTINPRITLFNPRALGSRPSLSISFGLPNDVVYGGTYTVKTITAAKVEVHGVTLDDPSLYNRAFAIHKQTRKVVGLNAVSQADYEIPLPRDNQYRGLLLYAHTDNPFATIALGSLINNIRIRINKTDVRYRKQTAAELIEDNRMEFGIAPDTGFAFFDFLEKGDLADLVNSRNFTDLDLVVDVSSVANAFLVVCPIQVVAG